MDSYLIKGHSSVVHPERRTGQRLHLCAANVRILVLCFYTSLHSPDCTIPALQGSGDPFEMFNNLFGGGMGGMGGAGRGGQQKMKFNMGGGGGGGMGGGGIEELLMGGRCTLDVCQGAQPATLSAFSAVTAST